MDKLKFTYTTEVENGEEVKMISKDIIEGIVDSLMGNVFVEYEYSAGESATWDDPGCGSSMDVDVIATLSMKEIMKKYAITKGDFNALHDALVHDLDYYFDDFCDYVKDIISNELPAGYSITSASASIKYIFSVHEFSLDFEIDEYDIDDREYEDSMRPEPDYYDDRD